MSILILERNYKCLIHPGEIGTLQVENGQQRVAHFDLLNHKWYFCPVKVEVKKPTKIIANRGRPPTTQFAIWNALSYDPRLKNSDLARILEVPEHTIAVAKSELFKRGPLDELCTICLGRVRDGSCIKCGFVQREREDEPTTPSAQAQWTNRSWDAYAVHDRPKVASCFDKPKLRPISHRVAELAIYPSTPAGRLLKKCDTVILEVYMQHPELRHNITGEISVLLRGECDKLSSEFSEDEYVQKDLVQRTIMLTLTHFKHMRSDYAPIIDRVIDDFLQHPPVLPSSKPATKTELDDKSLDETDEEISCADDH